MPTATPTARFDLSALVDRLQRARFTIDTRQYLAAHELLLALAARGDDLASDPDRLASFLGPIFCTSIDEQQRFKSELLSDRLDAPGPTDTGRTASTSRQPRHRHPRRGAAGLIAAVVVIAALGGWWWMRPSSPAPSPAPTPSPSTTSPPPTPIEAQKPATQPVAVTPWGTIAGAALAAAGLWLAIAWAVERARRQLALRRLPAYEDPEQVALPVPEMAADIVPDLLLRRAGAALSRRREETVLDLDVGATVDATARAAGFFTPQYSARRSTSEYVALIQRRAIEDHQAAVFDTHLTRLRGRGIEPDVYFFHDDPRVCYERESVRALRLTDIVNRHHRATLIVCGDARLAFTASGAPASWIAQSSALERRIFWTPEPPYRWSHLERDLEDAGFTVLPANDDGWRAFVDLDAGWRSESLFPAQYARPYPPLAAGRNDRRWLDRNAPPDDIAELLVRQARDFLGPDGFSWLCACAVYPDIRWGLTLRVAGASHAVLPSLSRLPWFRYGFMPDWLRRALVAQLPRRDQTRLRGVLKELLNELSRRARSARGLPALAQSTLFISPVDVLRAAPAGSPLGDRVFLGFMARAIVDPLSVDVPDTMRRLFAGRVGQFAGPGDAGGSLRRLAARVRAWTVFHPARMRIVQAFGLGLLALAFWRPAQPIVIVPAPVPVPMPAPAPGPAADAIPKPADQAPPQTPLQPNANSAAVVGSVRTTLNEPLAVGVVLRNLRTGAIAARTQSNADGAFALSDIASGTYAAEAVGSDGSVIAVSAIASLNAGETVSVMIRVPAASTARATRNVQPQAELGATSAARVQNAPPEPAPAASDNPLPASVPTTVPPPGPAPAAPGAGALPAVNPAVQNAAPDAAAGAAQSTAPQPPLSSGRQPISDAEAINSVLQAYARALESLKPENVQPLFPSINMRDLRLTLQDYRSLTHTIRMVGTPTLSPDGQTAVVVTEVLSQPTVVTGRSPRATPQRVTYTMRRTGATWIIQNEK